MQFDTAARLRTALNELRIHRVIRVALIAEQTGMSQSQIYRWLQGRGKDGCKCSFVGWMAWLAEHTHNLALYRAITEALTPPPAPNGPVRIPAQAA